MGSRVGGIVPLKQVEYGVNGDFIIMYRAIYCLLKGDHSDT